MRRKRTHQSILSSTQPPGKRKRGGHRCPPLNPSPRPKREFVTYKIQTVSAEQYRYVNVVINGKPLFALVDTGASITVISRLAFQQCFAQDLNDCPSNVRFLGASGTVIEMAGKAKLNFTVAGIESTRDVFVAENLSESCILGLDFLQDHGCIVDYDVMTLKAGGGTLPLLREPDVEREAVIEVIRRRKAAFSLSKRDLGKTNIFTHSIDTGDAAPIRQHPRRTSEENKRKVDELLKDMLNDNVISHSQSPWSSPVVLVKKKDGNTRFCIDYRAVNDCTKKHSFPLPRIDDSLDQLSGCKYFTTLDLKSGYWQIPMSEGDREKTAFTCHRGLFNFNVMPFGLANAPATFQHLMRIVLDGVEWNGALAYLDDIIIYARTFQDHLRNLDDVLSRLVAGGLKLKPSKCNLFKEEVRFLGHVVSKSGVSCDPEKISAVSNWPVPSSIKDVRQFLGLASYYRKFVRDFAKIAAPLYDLTKPQKQFCWNDKFLHSFNLLKDSLVTNPVLRYPDFTQQFILDTDASNSSLGCVLSQIVDGEEHPVSYASRSLTKAERNYSTTRKELLAIVYGVQKFRCYLGTAFLLRTDHASLRWLWTAKETYGQCARWFEILADFDFKLIHRSGSKHSNADALSRRPQSSKTSDSNSVEVNPERYPFEVEENFKTCKTSTESVLSIDLREGFGWTPDQISQSQKFDEHLFVVLGWIRAGARPPFKKIKKLSSEVRHYWSLFGEFFLVHRCLYRSLEDTLEGKRLQLLVPKEMRPRVLKELHDASHGGGHMGVDRTAERVSRRFYWPRWKTDVREYCERCTLCDLRKAPSKPPRAPLVPSDELEPMQRIEIDVLGGLPVTHSRNRYILVAADMYTKYMQAWSMPSQTAQETAIVLYHNWMTIHGVPERIHSDRGGNFESQLFKELIDLLGCKKSRTTAYHPSGNGAVERANRTILSIMKNYVQRDPLSWDKSLSSICATYNASRHEETGVSPHFLLTGQELRLPADLMTGQPSSHPSSSEMFDLQDRMRLVHEVVKMRLDQRRQSMKERYDKSVSRQAEFQVGDKVMLRNTVISKDEKRKFHLPYSGPYEVVETFPPVNYLIRNNERTLRVHFNRLKVSRGDHHTGMPSYNQASSPEDVPQELDTPLTGAYFFNRPNRSNANRHESNNFNNVCNSRNNGRLRRSPRRTIRYPDVETY
ncbi:unnamed protein product [Clavelina lepadiformis]|uniref:Gypsy retrotransposon integrase-like protein 1 n=1 Tax=Clavelina lepadiformis TaxID=159417 RepID=A0ABP0F3M0_CLALP